MEGDREYRRKMRQRRNTEQQILKQHLTKIKTVRLTIFFLLSIAIHEHVNSVTSQQSIGSGTRLMTLNDCTLWHGNDQVHVHVIIVMHIIVLLYLQVKALQSFNVSKN